MANQSSPKGFTHERIETNNFLMIVLVTLVVAVGGLVEIVPLFFQKSTTQPLEGVKPYGALQLAGRDVYISEGCYNCHSQMIRPFQAETLRYGPYSVAGEFVYDRPFQWGSKRTGPDLARVGGRYSDEWHRIHLNNPRDLVPESNMPAYSWLDKKMVNAEELPAASAGRYNSKRLGQANGRDEARLTKWGGASSPIVSAEATGSLVVFAFHSRQGNDADFLRIWFHDEWAQLEHRCADRLPLK